MHQNRRRNHSHGFTMMPYATYRRQEPETPSLLVKPNATPIAKISVYWQKTESALLPPTCDTAAGQLVSRNRRSRIPAMGVRIPAASAIYRRGLANACLNIIESAHGICAFCVLTHWRGEPRGWTSSARFYLLHQSQVNTSDFVATAITFQRQIA